jgi:hypothetical protein
MDVREPLELQKSIQVYIFNLYKVNSVTNLQADLKEWHGQEK